MRSAIISDIHGNLEGLFVALEDAASVGCDRVVCLGDLVEGGPSDREVIREIRRRCIPCVQGNHDDWFSITYDDEDANFLASLPQRLVENDLLFIHISPRTPARTIRDRYEAWGVFDETTERLIFVGHSHVPLIFAEKEATTGSAAIVPFVPNIPVSLDRSNRYVICPGAIGYGRDGIHAVRYGIFDDKQYSMEIRSIPGHVIDL